jgi:hypothetical protein
MRPPSASYGLRRPGAIPQVTVAGASPVAVALYLQCGATFTVSEKSLYLPGGCPRRADGGGITIGGYNGGALPVEVRIFRSPGRQTIHIAVAKTEKRGDQDSIVNLRIGCAQITGARDVLSGYILAAELNLAGDSEQSFQFFRYFSVFEIRFYALDQVFVAAQTVRGDGAVNGLAVGAIVLRGNIGGN